MVRGARGLALSRRDLLRGTALAAGFAALGRLRLPAAAAVAAAPETPAGLMVLSPYEAGIMTAIGDRMVYSPDPALPRFRDTGAVATIDRALAQLDEGLRQQARWLLWAFEWGPPVFAATLSTFSRLPAAAQDAYLNGWATSPRQLRILAFRALKNLSMLGYYAQPSTWRAIGYDGPWLARPAEEATG